MKHFGRIRYELNPTSTVGLCVEVLEVLDGSWGSWGSDFGLMSVLLRIPERISVDSPPKAALLPVPGTGFHLGVLLTASMQPSVNKQPVQHPPSGSFPASEVCRRRSSGHLGRRFGSASDPDWDRWRRSLCRCSELAGRSGFWHHQKSFHKHQIFWFSFNQNNKKWRLEMFQWIWNDSMEHLSLFKVTHKTCLTFFQTSCIHFMFYTVKIVIKLSDVLFMFVITKNPNPFTPRPSLHPSISHVSVTHH